MRAIRLLGALILALALALVLTACGDGGDGGEGGPAAGDGGPAVNGGGGAAMGPGLSIEEAQASELEGALLVRGYLVLVEGQPARLCAALAESMPPQCGGASLEVEGLDPAEHELRSQGGTSWSEGEVKLLGEVADGRLLLSGGNTTA